MTDAYFTTSAEAEAAFYKAFEERNIEAMAEVWADLESVECTHPMGPRVCGWDEVVDSWRRIFASGQELRFQLSEEVRTEEGHVAVHRLHENILHGPQMEYHAVVVVTNIFLNTSDGWRMILHHASPLSPEDEEFIELDEDDLELDIEVDEDDVPTTIH